MKRALVLIVLAAGCGGAHADGPSIVVDESMGHPRVGDLAPDFELQGADGQPFRLSSLRGEIVALSFTTSWCPFSRAEQPHLASLARAYDGRVRFVGVSLDETDEGFQSYLAREQMPFPVLHDARAEHLGAFIPEHPPTHFRDPWKTLVTANIVVDREGRIAFYTLVDLAHFDAELVHVHHALDSLLAAR